MRYLILILSLCSVILTCPRSLPAEGGLDRLLRILIVGQWEQGPRPYGISNFSEDGHYEATLYKSGDQKEILVRLSGTWRIEDARLHVILSEVIPPLFDSGTVIVEDMVSINGREMVLIDPQGKEYSKIRID